MDSSMELDLGDVSKIVDMKDVKPRLVEPSLAYDYFGYHRRINENYNYNNFETSIAQPVLPHRMPNFIDWQAPAPLCYLEDNVDALLVQARVPRAFYTIHDPMSSSSNPVSSTTTSSLFTSSSSRSIPSSPSPSSSSMGHSTPSGSSPFPISASSSTFISSTPQNSPNAPASTSSIAQMGNVGNLLTSSLSTTVNRMIIRRPYILRNTTRPSTIPMVASPLATSSIRSADTLSDRAKFHLRALCMRGIRTLRRSEQILIEQYLGCDGHSANVFLKREQQQRRNNNSAVAYNQAHYEEVIKRYFAANSV